MEQMNNFLIESKRLRGILSERNELAKILSDEIAKCEAENNLKPETGAFHSHPKALLSEIDVQGGEDNQEPSGNERLRNLVSLQENSLATLLQQHNSCFSSGLSSRKSRVLKIYISASDGGFPILQKDDPPSVVARKRLHFNCGGPSLLVYVDRNDYRVLSAFVCRNIRRSNSQNKDPSEILIEEAEAFRPGIVLLMPNNVTGYRLQALKELKERLGVYVVASDGDACSYNCDRIIKNLGMATQVDLLISVDGGFARIANRKGLSNVEYIPPFVNAHEAKTDVRQKNIDILFTGTGRLGLKMDNGEFMYQKRREFIKKVDVAFPNRLLVIGLAWDDLNLSNLRSEFISEELVHQYAMSSKIVIAYDGPLIEGFTSGRTFRTLMSKAFLLIRYFPGIEDMFINCRHLVWFKTDEEGLELIAYYLKHDDEREAIANGGHEYLLDRKGWRKKNVIVDYLIKKFEGTKEKFGELYGAYTNGAKNAAADDGTPCLPQDNLPEGEDLINEALREYNFRRWERAYREGYNEATGDHRRYFYNKYLEAIGYYQEVAKAQRVVEFAPGSGVFFEGFIRAAPQKQFFFIDISESNLQRLKARFSGYPNVFYILNDRRQLPLEGIGSIFSFLLCQCMPKSLWIEHLQETCRMLNDGGSYVFQFAFNPGLTANDSIWESLSGSQVYASDQMRAIVGDAGFRQVVLTPPIDLAPLNPDTETVWYLCKAVK